MAQFSEQNTQPSDARFFGTTHWSVVVAAGDSKSAHADEALEMLCRTYWYPLYAYVRRKGLSPEDAQDLTQEFFARLLEKKYLKLADRERGKFRGFLLTSLKHFLVNEWQKARAVKRGGGAVALPLDEELAERQYLAEPSADLPPDQMFEKRWAITVLEQVLTRLRQESVAAGKGELFELLKDFLWGDKNLASQGEIGVPLGLSASAVKSAVHRLRLRYRELLRAEIAHTVARTADIDEELRYLVSVLVQ
jgi:RNA polymerase sigma-70 factor (ECF subfamily)